MRLELVRIGNSRGIRIPKALLEQCDMDDAVEVRVDHGRLVIERLQGIRKGWREAFRDAGEPDDSLLLDSAPSNAFDQDEWTW